MNRMSLVALCILVRFIALMVQIMSQLQMAATILSCQLHSSDQYSKRLEFLMERNWKKIGKNNDLKSMACQPVLVLMISK